MADEGLEVIQSMIDISANRLERLRTQCATSAELTQQETRSLESKLVRMFCELLLTRQNLPNGVDIPATNDDLRQWLRVVGLSTQTINAVIQHVNTLETLLKMNDDDICAILTNHQTVPTEETRRLMCAVNNLKRCQQCIKTGTEPSDMYWDSWDRRHNIRLSSSSKIANNRLTTVIVSDQSIQDESLQSPIELSPPDTQNSMTSGTLTSSSDKLLHMISPEEGSSVSNLSPSPSPPQSPSVYNTTSQSSSGSNSRRLVTQKVHHNNNINNNILRFNGSNKDMTGSISSIGSNTTNSNNLNNNDIEIEMSVDSSVESSMSKSKSNESQLSVNGQQKPWQNGSVLSVSEMSSESAPIPAPRTRYPGANNHQDYSEGGYHLENHVVTPIIVSDTSAPPRSPCTPVRVMAHIIQHRFSKKFKFTTSTCDLCNKQMFFGFKCTECKYRCHKDCKSNVPPSCGLPKGMVDEFKKTLYSEGGLMPNPSPNLHRSAGLMPKKLNEPRHRAPMHSIPFHGADSSSAGSSCNSSSPSSPALLTIPPQTPANKSQFNFPEVSSAAVTNQNHQNSHHSSSYLPNTIIEDAEFEPHTHSSKSGDGPVHLRNNNFTSNYQHSLTSMINSEMGNQPVKLNGSITDSNGELLNEWTIRV